MSATDTILATNLEPLAHYYSCPEVVELQVTEPGRIWVETPPAGLKQVVDEALSLDYFRRLARNIANIHHITNYEQKPYLGVVLPDGHRLRLCLGPTIKTGVAMSMRIWRPRLYKLNDFSISEADIKLLERAIHNKWNIIVSGGMFSGKTTFTNALLELVPEQDRVISVEYMPELDLNHIANRSEFVINQLATTEEIGYLQVLGSIQQLRPDRTVIGELSTDNTWILSRIINMGHGGTITTLHADSPKLAFNALRLNVEMAGYPANAAEEVFRENIHAIVQVRKPPGSYKREVTEIWTNEHLPEI